MKILIRFLAMAFLISGTTCFADKPWQEGSKRFCDDNDINYQEAKNFANRLNFLAEQDDRKSIVQMIHYPLKVTKNKKSGERIMYYIENEKIFSEQYHFLFNRKIKQNLEQDHYVLCDSLGNAGTAGGDFWFSKFNDGLKIYVINTPNNF